MSLSKKRSLQSLWIHSPTWSWSKFYLARLVHPACCRPRLCSHSRCSVSMKRAVLQWDCDGISLAGICSWRQKGATSSLQNLGQANLCCTILRRYCVTTFDSFKKCQRSHPRESCTTCWFYCCSLFLCIISLWLSLMLWLYFFLYLFTLCSFRFLALLSHSFSAPPFLIRRLVAVVWSNRTRTV